MALFVITYASSFSKEVLAKGKTFTSFGDYTIEECKNPIFIKNKELKTFILKYENYPTEIKVAILKNRKCKDYIVISDKLTIKYICNKYYFGVERFDRSFEKLGYITSDTYLDKSEYFHQKILGPGETNDIKGMQLVAAYFPHLIKK